MRKRATRDLHDQGILSSYQGGDVETGARLLEDGYGAYIRSIVASGKWKFDVFTQQDVRQVIVGAVSRRLPTFEVKGSLKAFISRVAHNQCVDEVRRQARRQAHEYLYQDRELEDGPAFEPVDVKELDPHDAIVCNERALMARELIDALGEKCREVLSLRYLEELSYKDIQKRLGIPLGTVCKRISDCLERARKMPKIFGEEME